MRRFIAMLASVALGAAVIAARAPRPAPEHFSILLNYTATGWSAHCEQGCAASWTASFACRTACDARVNAQGIVTLAETRTVDSSFAFTVERTAVGVVATSTLGTAWTTLSWGCATQPCRARITDLGVSLLGR